MDVAKRIADLEKELTDLRKRYYHDALLGQRSHVTLVRIDVAGYACALPLDDVQGIERMVAIRPIPGAAGAAAGLIDVRGQLVPVIDTAWLLLRQRSLADLQQQLVLAHAHGHLVALIVDAVIGLLEVGGASPAAFEAAQLGSLPEEGSVHVLAVVRAGEQVVHVLSPDTLIARDEVAAVVGGGP